ncbi:MAG: CvpA family protein [Oscillospiraceae bacterium]|nr:CvpA family protein [Oscillospiraceae bacterium]
MVHWIIDIVLLLILIGCAWKGYRNGLIPGIFMLLALFASLYGAKLVAETYSEEFISILEPFASGMTDRAMRELEDEDVLKGNDVYAASKAILEEIGFMGSAAENIAGELDKEVNETGHVLRAAMVKRLCIDVAYVLTLVIAFVLLAIAFAVIGNLISLSFHIPGLEVINGILGAVFGLGEGAVFAFFIAWLLRFGGMLLKAEVVEETILLKWLQSVNPLVEFFGI